MPALAWSNQPLDLSVKAGAALSLFVFRRAVDGTIVNVTGATARMKASRTDFENDETSLFDVSTTSGITIVTRTVTFDDGHTESIKGFQVAVAGTSIVRGKYDHDFKVTLSGGSPAYWFAGTLTVERSVTP